MEPSHIQDHNAPVAVLVAAFILILIHTPAGAASPHPYNHTIRQCSSALQASAASVHQHHRHRKQLPHEPVQATVMLTVESLCNTTSYPTQCMQTLATYPHDVALLQELTAYVAESALVQLNATYSLGMQLLQNGNDNINDNGKAGSGFNVSAVVEDCVELLDDAVAQLTSAVEHLLQMEVMSLSASSTALDFQRLVTDVRVWVGAAYTDQGTCWDEFGEMSSAAGSLDSRERSVRDRLRRKGQLIAPLLEMALFFAQSLQAAGPSTYYSLCAST